MKGETQQGAPKTGRGAASEVREAAQEQSREFLGQAKESGRTLIEDQKGVLADHAGHWAAAMHAAAENLERDGEHTASRYADRASDGLQRLSRTLAEQSPDEFMHRTRDFARRQPALFVGGAILAGIAVSQLFRPATAGGPSEGAEVETLPMEPAEPITEPPPIAEAEYGALESRKPGSAPSGAE